MVDWQKAFEEYVRATFDEDRTIANPDFLHRTLDMEPEALAWLRDLYQRMNAELEAKYEEARSRRRSAN